ADACLSTSIHRRSHVPLEAPAGNSERGTWNSDSSSPTSSTANSPSNLSITALIAIPQPPHPAQAIPSALMSASRFSAIPLIRVMLSTAEHGRDSSICWARSGPLWLLRWSSSKEARLMGPCHDSQAFAGVSSSGGVVVVVDVVGVVVGGGGRGALARLAVSTVRSSPSVVT